MEPVAVNHVTITRELFAESHDAVFSVRRLKMLRYGGLVFFAAGLILLGFSSRLPFAASLYLPLLLTGAVVVLWSLTLKKTDLRKKYRIFTQKNGENPTRTITCDRTGLEVDKGSGKPLCIQYTEVREMKETPHLYLLLCSGHTGVQLSREGFETGSWEALKQAVDRAKKEAEAMAELI